MSNSTRPHLERFIVVEGIDGTGTTTQLKRLERLLPPRGILAWVSQEPSTLPTGRLVRRILSGELPAQPETLARLFSADRHEHLYGADGALAHLGKGELVIFDRYLFSSLAYQGMACGNELPEQLNADFPLPELLLYFDVDPSISMARVEGRTERDIYEYLPLQRRIRAAYEEILASFAGASMRIVRIDASLSIDGVSKAVDAAIAPIIERMHIR